MRKKMIKVKILTRILYQFSIYHKLGRVSKVKKNLLIKKLIYKNLSNQKSLTIFYYRAKILSIKSLWLTSTFSSSKFERIWSLRSSKDIVDNVVNMWKCKIFFGRDSSDLLDYICMYCTVYAVYYVSVFP